MLRMLLSHDGLGLPAAKAVWARLSAAVEEEGRISSSQLRYLVSPGQAVRVCAMRLCSRARGTCTGGVCTCALALCRPLVQMPQVL